VDVDRQVLVIKPLNEEYLVDVYLCEDATKIIKGESARVGKPIIPCAIGLLVIMVYVILDRV
jgi:hypothetical protein